MAWGRAAGNARPARTPGTDDHLDFVVRPGAVTGFLGPNGAGKPTTMRMVIGLDAPTSGTVRAVARGDAVVAPALTRRLLDAYAHHLPTSSSGHQGRTDPRWQALTEREREILGARDRVQAVIIAYDLGLTPG